MENLIQFMDFGKSTGRGRRLDPLSVSVWYNRKDRGSYGVTFSNDIKTDKKRVKIGKIGERICFVFTDESEAITLNKSKNVVFRSYGFVSFMFDGQIIEGKSDRKVLKLERLESNIYIIKN
jgi:hypothetical protein